MASRVLFLSLFCSCGSLLFGCDLDGVVHRLQYAGQRFDPGECISCLYGLDRSPGDAGALRQLALCESILFAQLMYPGGDGGPYVCRFFFFH